MQNNATGKHKYFHNIDFQFEKNYLCKLILSIDISGFKIDKERLLSN